jgi:hypothetical protein
MDSQYINWADLTCLPLQYTSEEICCPEKAKYGLLLDCKAIHILTSLTQLLYETVPITGTDMSQSGGQSLCLDKADRDDTTRPIICQKN